MKNGNHMVIPGPIIVVDVVVPGPVATVEVDVPTAPTVIEVVLPGPQGIPGIHTETSMALPFSWADVGSSPLKIGTVQAGTTIPEVVLIITTPFNQPVTLEVGPASAPAELMLGVDSNPSVAESYQVMPDKTYASNTDLYLTLSAGTLPTTGAGHVIVYL